MQDIYLEQKPNGRKQLVAPVSVNSAVPTENKCKNDFMHLPQQLHNFEQADSQLGVEQPKECCIYIYIS